VVEEVTVWPVDALVPRQSTIERVEETRNQTQSHPTDDSHRASTVEIRASEQEEGSEGKH
jgi:hypothetical protein